MEILIRQALATEINILLEFEKAIIAAERPFDETLKAGEIHYYDLLELIQSNKAEVLIALVNNEVVASGYAKIMEAKPYLRFSEYAYLGFMYVKEAFRGMDINKQLIEALIAWSKSKNITEVRLEVYNDNERAKKAYTKCGFTPNLLEMRLEI